MQRRRLLLIILILSMTIIPVSLYMFKRNENVAQDFSLTDLKGNVFHLSDFRGKIVVIEFMATWCSYCRQQIVYYEKVWEEYTGKVILIIIDIDARESEDTLRKFASQFSHSDWIWAEDTANLVKSYMVTAIPKTVIIDRNGIIHYSHTGLMSPSTFKEKIEQLLG